MNKDQADRVAEKVELPRAATNNYISMSGIKYDLWTENQVREAIAAALVKFTEEQEPVAAYLHDDGHWSAAKTEEGRKLSSRLSFVGSTKIGVYTHPVPSQQEERKPHCSECAEYIVTTKADHQWCKDVAKGREIIKDLTAHNIKKQQ